MSSQTRRGFLVRGLAGAAVIAAGAVPLGLRKTRLPAVVPTLSFFSAAEYAVFRAVADQLLPGGAGWPPASSLDVAARADALFALADEATQADVRQLLGLFDNALVALLLDGRPTPFTALAPAEQGRALDAWRTSRLVLRRSGFSALRNVAMAIYYADPSTWEGVGYPGPPEIVR
jgi:hypothetical protein